MFRGHLQRKIFLGKKDKIKNSGDEHFVILTLRSLTSLKTNRKFKIVWTDTELMVDCCQSVLVTNERKAFSNIHFLQSKRGNWHWTCTRKLVFHFIDSELMKIRVNGTLSNGQP